MPGMSWGTMVIVDYLLAKQPPGVISLVFSGPCLSARRWGSDVKGYLETLPIRLQAAIRDCGGHGRLFVFYKTYVCRMGPWPKLFTRTLDGLSKPVYEYMGGPANS
jgi:hypothetical protein